jgi:hypothetical protein
MQHLPDTIQQHTANGTFQLQKSFQESVGTVVGLANSRRVEGNQQR